MSLLSLLGVILVGAASFWLDLPPFFSAGSAGVFFWFGLLGVCGGVHFRVVPTKKYYGLLRNYFLYFCSYKAQENIYNNYFYYGSKGGLEYSRVNARSRFLLSFSAKEGSYVAGWGGFVSMLPSGNVT